MPSNRRGTVRRSTVVVDIGLDVGVNVGQGTSTCGRPIREQKNTRYKWEVRSREPFSPPSQLRMPLLPLFHNTISPRISRLRPPRNLGRDSLQRSHPRQHLDYKTNPFLSGGRGIDNTDGGGRMQSASTFSS